MKIGEYIMKIGMMGFDFESPNKGCEALTYSFINMLLECYGNDLQIVNFSYGGFGIFPERYPEIDFLIRRPKIKNPIDWIKIKNEMAGLDIIFDVTFGDGFSDIYGDRLFIGRMNQTFILWKVGIPLIMLPQTIGPFKKKYNYDIALRIMRYAKKIYVRDNRYIEKLDSVGLTYERAKDLSAYMLPQPWNININSNSIGINVSGLAYSNRFPNLEGQFDAYPELIHRLINHFRQKGCTVYLIPHSYNCSKPNENNDDMVACRMAYDRLKDKTNVVFVDEDLISPRVKYVISKMSFFIGTRMHANFAAIFTNVPLFGLAYSYKFQGAFEENGLFNRTVMINNIKNEEIDGIIARVEKVYQQQL